MCKKYFLLIALVMSLAISLTGCGMDSSNSLPVESVIETVAATSQAEESSSAESSSEESVSEPTETPAVSDFQASLLDSELAKCVKAQLGMDESETLTQEMINSVNDIEAYDYRITHLNGLEYFHNLEYFATCDSSISDISVITKIPHLKIFTLGSGKCLTIPDLSNNTELEQLSLSMCGVEDLTPLTTSSSLKSVYLSTNHITSLACLKDYTGLEILDITNNPILDYETILDNASLVEAITRFDFDINLSIQTVEKAKQIVAEQTTDDMPILQKEMLLFDYVRNNTHYEVVYGFANPFGYDCLMDGHGVCGQFADGLTLLLQVAGIEAYSINSDTHAWTYVNIEGKWYHCDALWDQGNLGELIYFNAGSEKILTTPDHVYDTEILPMAEVEDMPLEYYKQYVPFEE